MADTGEPFGLPSGTVRGIIALTFAGLTVYNFVTTGTLDSILLATSGPYLGFYFAGRQADTAAKAVVDARAAVDAVNEEVDPPYTGIESD